MLILLFLGNDKYSRELFVVKWGRCSIIYFIISKNLDLTAMGGF